MKIFKGVAFRPCPHCGDDPEISTEGSCIDVECCASMTFQKSDILTMDERRTWNGDTHIHSPEAEDKALNTVAALWNKRSND